MLLLLSYRRTMLSHRFLLTVKEYSFRWLFSMVRGYDTRVWLSLQPATTVSICLCCTCSRLLAFRVAADANGLPSYLSTGNIIILEVAYNQ